MNSKRCKFSLRFVTGYHSLEFHSAIGNKESVENNIIHHFWFCLSPPPLKIALAIRWSTFSQEFFGCSWLYVKVIYEYLGHVEFFMRSIQFVPALVWIFCFSIWTKKSKFVLQILKTCLWPNVSSNFVFVIRGKLIIIKHRYELRFLKLTS